MAKETVETMFGITGATGAIGGRIASRLAELSYAQRLIVRDASRAPDLPGASVAEASYANPQALLRALTNVQTLFIVSTSEAPDRVERDLLCSYSERRDERSKRYGQRPNRPSTDDTLRVLAEIPRKLRASA